ncbi:MAG: hypothetical protein IPJ40_14175 [Saprospirales bacterium]|nr:hypothetical protein [Saprospirales bacterium]
MLVHWKATENSRSELGKVRRKSEAQSKPLLRRLLMLVRKNSRVMVSERRPSVVPSSQLLNPLYRMVEEMLLKALMS